MSLLRIYAPLGEAPSRCEWALVDELKPAAGEGTLAELPRGADRVQLIIPAAQVLIARASVPQSARRRAGSMLAFAVEDATAAEPEANQVSWLGIAGDIDLLAVVDRQGLERWRAALEARIGKPVVTSTQAVLWHALRLAGVTAPISRKPNPRAPSPSMCLPSLSSPAASPTGFGKSRPITRTGTRGAEVAASDAMPSRARTSSDFRLRPCALSGSSAKSSGRTAR